MFCYDIMYNTIFFYLFFFFLNHMILAIVLPRQKSFQSINPWIVVVEREFQDTDNSNTQTFDARQAFQ